MSMIPSLIGSLAGLPLAQTKGAEADRAIRESSDKAREVAADERAESAAGIGATEEESAAGDRDGDGRQVLVRFRKEAEPESDEEAKSPPRAKDPAHQSGTQLDLEG
jgi:hypothetical protein